MKAAIFALCLTFAAVCSVRGQARPVNIAVYYETLCPYSKDFIVNQLLPTYLLLGDEVITAHLVPYGNCESTPNGNSWNFTCQHGPEECVGNLIQTCAINYYPATNKTVPFVGCSEAVDDPVVVSQQCAEDNDMDWDVINTCANSDEGAQLEYNLGIETGSLDPPFGGTPWIVIDGIHNTIIQNMAQNELLSLVCTFYQGPTPDGCAGAKLTA